MGGALHGSALGGGGSDAGVDNSEGEGGAVYRMTQLFTTLLS